MRIRFFVTFLVLGLVTAGALAVAGCDRGGGGSNSGGHSGGSDHSKH